MQYYSSFMNHIFFDREATSETNVSNAHADVPDGGGLAFVSRKTCIFARQGGTQTYTRFEGACNLGSASLHVTCMPGSTVYHNLHQHRRCILDLLTLIYDPSRRSNFLGLSRKHGQSQIVTLARHDELPRRFVRSICWFELSRGV